MKKLFKDGWRYALFTFAIPAGILLAGSLLLSGPHASELGWLAPIVIAATIPILINTLFGPSIWAYWRRCVNLKGILIVNCILLVLTLVGGRMFFPGWILWAWAGFGKVRS